MTELTRNPFTDDFAFLVEGYEPVLSESHFVFRLYRVLCFFGLFAFILVLGGLVFKLALSIALVGHSPSFEPKTIYLATTVFTCISLFILFLLFLQAFLEKRMHKSIYGHLNPLLREQILLRLKQFHESSQLKHHAQNSSYGYALRERLNDVIRNLVSGHPSADLSAVYFMVGEGNTSCNYFLRCVQTELLKSNRFLDICVRGSP